MRRTCKIFCGIVAVAMLLTGCGSGATQSQSAAEKPAETSAVESEQAEPTLDDLDATAFKIADMAGMIGKSQDDIKAAFPDTTFINYDNDASRMATKAEVVGSECTVIVQFIDGKSEAVLVYYDVSNATSYFVGETYMKIRNTICQSMGDPVLAYDPVYTEVSASQIGMAFEDGKEVQEQWEGSDYKAEMYLINAEDSMMLVGFYTPVYESAQGQ